MRSCVDLVRPFLLLAFLASGCAAPTTDSSETGTGGAGQAFVLPPRPAITPTLPDAKAFDTDRDRIADQTLVGDAAERVQVHVVMRRPLEPGQLEAFVSVGGEVRHVFRALSFGFVGSIARGRIAELPPLLGDALHLVALTPPVETLGDVETRVARARAAWPTVTGSPNTTIAIIDSGIDDSHPDLAGRQVFWKDYSSDAHPTPRDAHGHGTHVAGLALGSGAAFADGPTDSLRYSRVGDFTGWSQGSLTYATAWTRDPVTATVTATFGGTVTQSLKLDRYVDGVYGGNETRSGASPLAITGLAMAARTQISTTLQPNAYPGAAYFALTLALAGYGATDDGFPTMSGVAPGTRWYGAKIFRDDLSPDGTCIFIAFDDLLMNHEEHSVKVLNLSISSSAPTIDAALTTLVDHGIVVVASAGNSGPTGEISLLGTTPRVITVGSANVGRRLTSYTSIGDDAETELGRMKPDLLAPGGDGTVDALSSDTNDADGVRLPDAQADDYTGMLGTSMAAPIVSGAAALVIDALESRGYVWEYGSPAGPLLVKSLLLATASETNQTRAAYDEASSPPLGRASTPKDRFEGYGLINVDAAIEAVTTEFASPLVGISDGSEPESQKRVWARRMPIEGAASAQLGLDVPAGADFDLYVYLEEPDEYGNPRLLASSARAGAGLAETITFTSPITQTALVVVKRVSGDGTFTLTGSVGTRPPVLPPPDGPVAFTSVSLGSDAGTPSTSVWGQYVSFSYVAVGTVINGAPTGLVEFRTSGMLVDGGPYGGVFGTAPFVADGPGCESRPSPCSSAVLTTAALLPTALQPSEHHRITATFAGSDEYLARAAVFLNGNTNQNHVVNTRTGIVTPTASTADVWLMLRRPLVVRLTTTFPCPDGKTCAPVARHPGFGVDANADCVGVTQGQVIAVDSEWRGTCLYPGNPLFMTNLRFRVRGDGRYVQAYGNQGPPIAGQWSRLYLSHYSGPSTTAPGESFVLGVQTQGNGPVEIVDGPCDAVPPAPLLVRYEFPNPSSGDWYSRQLAIDSLTSGVHTIHACTIVDGARMPAGSGYSPGNADNGYVESMGLIHTVTGSTTPVATTLTVAATPAASTYGANVSFVATVTDGSAPVTTGAVAFVIDGGHVATSPVGAGGEASYATAALDVGTHPVAVGFATVPGYLGSSATLNPSLVVSPATPSATIEVEPSSPVGVGREVVLRAHLGRAVGATPSARLPTGRVTFREGSTVLCANVPLVELSAHAVSAECDVGVAVNGSHTIALDYASGPDGRYALATPPTLTYEVQRFASTVSFVSPPSASIVGASVSFTVRVAQEAGNPLVVPSGAVRFSVGSTTLCNAVPLSGGLATCATDALEVGAGQSIVATYAGDATFVGSSGSTTITVAKIPTATSVTTSGSPSSAGDAITFEARVVAIAPGTGIPTGLVDLVFDGGATMVDGSAGLTLDAAGRVAFTTSALGVGTHSVVVRYAGDARYAASLAADETASTQVVEAAETTVTLSLVPSADSPYGESRTVRATVTGGPVATGSVTIAIDGGAPIEVQLDEAGVAEFVLPLLSVGSHAIEVIYAGDASHDGDDATITHEVSSAESTVTLVSSHDPWVVGEDLVLTSTVQVASGNGVATGTVSFEVDGAPVGSPVALSTGTGPTFTATFTTSSLGVGDHTIVARYSGDANVEAGSATIQQRIVATRAELAEVTITVEPAMPTYGVPTTLVVVVTDGDGAPATGEVHVVLVGGSGSTTITLDANGRATVAIADLTEAPLEPGSYVVTATYGEGATPASGSVTVVVGRGTTSTVLETSSDAPLSGEELTLTARVTPVGGSVTPTGRVTFYDGDTVLGTVDLDASGVATFVVPELTAGAHAFRAEFVGDDRFAPSDAEELTIEVRSKVRRASGCGCDVGAGGAIEPFVVAFVLLAGAMRRRRRVG